MWNLGYAGVPIAGHALRAEFGEIIVFVSLGVHQITGKCATVHDGIISSTGYCWKLHVGGWLTHGDFALESGADFLAVVEHRLIPAGVRGEWSRLRRCGVSSIWVLPVRRLLMLVMLVLV